MNERMNERTNEGTNQPTNERTTVFIVTTTFTLNQSINQSINQSRRSSMAPYVAEPFVGAKMMCQSSITDVRCHYAFTLNKKQTAAIYH